MRRSLLGGLNIYSSSREPRAYSRAAGGAPIVLQSIYRGPELEQAEVESQAKSEI